MGRRKFQRLRLALFANSYCGKHLATVLAEKYEKDQTGGLKEIALLAGALNFPKRPLSEIITKEKCLRRTICPENFTCPKDISEVRIFLSIEREMWEIAEGRFMEELLEVDDYTGGILSSAVERATGNKLAKIDSDGEFEGKLQETERRYQNCYYRIAYRYKLPTIRILPFILRLITP